MVPRPNHVQFQRGEFEGRREGEWGGLGAKEGKGSRPGRDGVDGSCTRGCFCLLAPNRRIEWCRILPLTHSTLPHHIPQEAQLFKRIPARRIRKFAGDEPTPPPDDIVRTKQLTCLHAHTIDQLMAV